MELPVIKTEEVTKTVVLGDKMFVIRPWKTKDEKNFLIKQTTMKKKDQDDPKALEKLLVEELVKPCIIDGDIDSISYDELKKLIIDIRCLSIGDDINDVTFECPKCEKNNIIDIMLEDEGVVTFKPTDIELKKISEVLSVRFKSVPFKKMSKDMSEYDYIYNSIDEIVYEEVSYKDFTRENFEQFFDSFDINTSKEIVEAMKDSVNSTVVKKEVLCQHCGEKKTIDLGNMTNFYTP